MMWIALLLAALSAPATATSAAPELDALLARLQRPAPATAPFVEVRFSKLLATPLNVSGELEYRAADSLLRRVAAPYRERTEIRSENVVVEREGQKPRRFSLKRAPELRGILASFGALLGGDRATLERHFTIKTLDDGTHWSLALTPREARTKKRIREVLVVGRADEPRCFTVSETDGDASVMLVGDAARGALPQPLERETLAQLCRDGGG